MKLLIRRIKKEDDMRYCRVSLLDNMISFEMYQKGNVEDTLLCKTKYELLTMFKENTYFLCYLHKDNIVDNRFYFSEFFVGNNIQRTRDELFFQKSLRHFNANPLILIYFHDYIDEVAIIVNTLPVETNIEFDLDEDISPIDFIESVYKDSSLARKRLEARKSMLDKLDPNQSLAYLEVQVDVLSKMVFTLLDKMDDSVRKSIVGEIPELEQFKNLVSESSVLNVKSLSKCLAEIKETKTQVRKSQEEYYRSKA